MSRLALAVALAATATLGTRAHAEHDHAQHQHQQGAAPAGAALALSASLGGVAATYRQRLYTGEYAGGTVGVGAAYGRFVLMATLTGYQLARNGAEQSGLGDTMVHGGVTVVTRGAVAGGVQLMVMVPTGDDMAGLGMGHLMAMPAVWLAARLPAVSLDATVGYARGIGDASAHAEHGSWPIVAPMSFSELTAEGTALAALASTLDAGVHGTLAIPTGESPTRATAGIRIRWRAGRVETTADLQTGLAGDPFRVRGTLATAVRF